MKKQDDPLLGVTIDGRYKVLERIGGGGMGAVYKAEQAAMNRFVVVKILHLHLTAAKDKSEFIARFKREAQTASRVEHPNAVAIYDFGTWNDQPYIVMQYNQGKSLKAVLKREAPLDPRRSLNILRQVFAAVGAAHRIGIIHRDLKPDNIMCWTGPDGEEFVQVLDFGLAKAISSAETEMAVTRTGVVMGTPQYMAPEQAIAAELDARTDIYSLGVVLYELLTGTVPFSAESPVQLMFKHIKEKPEALSVRAPQFADAPEVERVVAKALKKEPKNRYASVEEFERELAAAVEAIEFPRVSNPPEAAAERPQVNEVAGQQPPPPAARLPQPLLVLALIAMLAGSIGFFYEPLFALFNPAEAARRAEQLRRDEAVDKHIALARDFLAKRDFRAAEYELQRALDVERQPRVFLELGKAYAKWGRIEQSLVVLENALNGDRGNPEIYLVYGNVLLGRNRAEQAAKAFERVLQLDPGNPAAEKGLRVSRQKLRVSRRS